MSKQLNTLSEVKQAMRELGHAVFENYSRPYNLNIVGNRSASRQAGAFDDRLWVFWPADEINDNAICFKNFTTDPGEPWLINPAMPQGTAILKAGQYRGAYAIDLHAGRYEALCQRLGKVTVWRDNDKDRELDIEPSRTVEQAGYFGINIHRAASEGLTTRVGMYSAGCQVFGNANDFKMFMQIVRNAAEVWGNKFTYTLLEEDA